MDGGAALYETIRPKYLGESSLRVGILVDEYRQYTLAIYYYVVSGDDIGKNRAWTNHQDN